jgi:hypothetical protein
MMSDGEALLLALVRRKGSAAALADWLWERMPAVLEGYRLAIVVGSRGMVAEVWWLARLPDAVWVNLVFRYMRKGKERYYSPRFHITTEGVTFGRTGADWLAQYLNETFIRRRK